MWPESDPFMAFRAAKSQLEKFLNYILHFVFVINTNLLKKANCCKNYFMSSISFGVRQNWVWILALRRLTVWHLRSLSLSFLVFKLGRNSATSRWGLLWKFNEIIYVKHLAQHRNEALPLLQRCDWPQWWYFLLAPNFTYGWRKCKRGPQVTHRTLI